MEGEETAVLAEVGDQGAGDGGFEAGDDSADSSAAGAVTLEGDTEGGEGGSDATDSPDASAEGDGRKVRKEIRDHIAEGDNMDLIITHRSCPDGFVAAYIAQKRYPKAEIMYRDHGLEPPYEEVTGKDVLVTDFSWRTREQNDKMASLAKSFYILDHHKTAQAVLEGAPYAVFDMKRSGAGLAWDYLFGKDSDFAVAFPKTERLNRPWFVDYVEDRDLWNWKLPHSKEICAYLGTLPFTKEAWDAMQEITEGSELSNVIQAGQGALAHINHYVREAVKQARTGHFLGRSVAVLNIPYLNCSEVGNELAKTNEVSLTWFERADDMIQFSLRSIGDIDVSDIAKTFRGGGHKNAAGFQLPLRDGRALIDSIVCRS